VEGKAQNALHGVLKTDFLRKIDPDAFFLLHLHVRVPRNHARIEPTLSRTNTRSVLLRGTEYEYEDRALAKSEKSEAPARVTSVSSEKDA